MFYPKGVETIAEIRGARKSGASFTPHQAAWKRRIGVTDAILRRFI